MTWRPTRLRSRKEGIRAGESMNESTCLFRIAEQDIAQLERTIILKEAQVKLIIHKNGEGRKNGRNEKLKNGRL